MTDFGLFVLSIIVPAIAFLITEFRTKKKKQVIDNTNIKTPFILDTPYMRSAIHESGHGLTAWSCTQVSEVTAIRIDYFGGGLALYSYPGNKDDQHYMYTAVICLGGIAAEMLVYKKFPSRGRQPDLQQALAAASKINNPSKDWNLPTCTGPSLDFKRVFRSISVEEAHLMDRAYRCAKAIVISHQNSMMRMALHLKEKRVLTGQQMEKFLGPRLFIKFCKPGFVLPKGN